MGLNEGEENGEDEEEDEDAGMFKWRRSDFIKIDNS
jgi:hypothetical protein